MQNGESYIADLPRENIEQMIESKHFEATKDFSMLSQADVVIICVPTPTTPDGTPNISYIEEATHAIGQNINANVLVILESTTYRDNRRNGPAYFTKNMVLLLVMICFSVFTRTC